MNNFKELTKEERIILVRELCGRLPYNVEIESSSGIRFSPHNIFIAPLYCDNYIIDYECAIDMTGDNDYIPIDKFRLVLLPFNETTNNDFIDFQDTNKGLAVTTARLIWSYENQVDLYGLIEKGLAISK